MLAKLLNKLERVAAYLTLCESRAAVRRARYSEILSELASASWWGKATTRTPSDTAYTAASPLDLSGAECDRFLSEIKSGSLYKKQYGCKLVLLRMDSTLRESAEQASSIVFRPGGGKNMTTVEHVLPQNPAEGSKWTELFDEPAREELTNCAGNLVLLSKKKNSKVSNLEFKTKLETYFELGTKVTKVSKFALTEDLKPYQEYTPKVVRERRDRLVNQVRDAWQLKQPGM